MAAPSRDTPCISCRGNSRPGAPVLHRRGARWRRLQSPCRILSTSVPIAGSLFQLPGQFGRLVADTPLGGQGQQGGQRICPGLSRRRHHGCSLVQLGGGEGRPCVARTLNPKRPAVREGSFVVVCSLPSNHAGKRRSVPPLPVSRRCTARNAVLTCQSSSPTGRVPISSARISHLTSISIATSSRRSAPWPYARQSACPIRSGAPSRSSRSVRESDRKISTALSEGEGELGTSESAHLYLPTGSAR